jgi:membrane fusion protein (multidrug efflux system)
MDREKGGFLVRLTLEPEKECLRSGCYAKVRVLVEEKKNALFVPRTVLLERGNITSLFQLSGEIALEKQVVTGISEMNRLEIISGVDVTQPIISEGIHELQDGDTVRVLEQDK